MMLRAVILVGVLLAPTAGLRLPAASVDGRASRRAAVSAAGALLFAGSAQHTAAVEARPTFMEARQDAKEDKLAAKLLKQTSMDELVAKSIANKEKESGRELSAEEKAAIAQKVKEMLGMDDE